MPWEPQAIGPSSLAHAPLADHLAGQLGVADEVVAGAGRQVAVDEQLGGTPTHAHGQRVFDVLAGIDVALFDGELLGHAESQPGRQDGDLVHGVGVLEHVGQHGVAALVEGDAFLLGLGEHQALASLAHEDPVAGGFEVLLVHLVRTPAHGVEGRLVDEVGEIGAAHAGSAPGHELEVDVGDRSACPCSGPPRSAGAPRGRGAGRRSDGRSGPGATARGRGCRGGWWPP